MEQYIPKSAVVEEIERRMDELYDFLPDASKVENGSITMSEACNTGKYTVLESFRRFIDTLEVKEVDIEKEVNEHWDEWAKEDGFHSIDFAEHFFALGMAVSNKAQKEK